MRIAWIVMVLLVAPGAQAQIYKWVDEKGQTHYEERPPDGKDTKDAKKMAAPMPSKEIAKPAGADWKQQEQDFKQRQLQRQQLDAADDRKRAQREKACADARSDLEHQSLRARFYTTDDKGEKRYRTDDEQAAVVTAARRKVQELCQ